jgi:hypothetical protein
LHHIHDDGSDVDLVFGPVHSRQTNRFRERYALDDSDYGLRWCDDLCVRYTGYVADLGFPHTDIHVDPGFRLNFLNDVLTLGKTR